MAKIFYTEVDDFLRKEARYKLLEQAKNVYGVDWKEIEPDAKYAWLTEGMDNDFDSLLPMGSKEGKRDSGFGEWGSVIFKIYNNGVKTNRDAWVYNFNSFNLIEKLKISIDFYNNHVLKFSNNKELKKSIDDSVDYDDNLISWDSNMKNSLRSNKIAIFSNNKIRNSIYRPYTKQYLFYDKIFNNTYTLFYKIFPTPETEKENLLICLSGVGSSKSFHSLIVNIIPCLDMLEKTQCFPFYTYNEDGSGRKENITDWGLKQFQEYYRHTPKSPLNRGDLKSFPPLTRGGQGVCSSEISKWDIFYYIYGVLHNPEYRTKYAANLRRSLPRIPFYDDFWKYSEAGKKLADLHVNYESQAEYPLIKIETPGKQLDWKVEKMRLSKDKQTIIYNDFLSLTGIPYEAYEYKLGNRSALEWIIDQYQIKIDKRSGITNDPNREDEPDYIVKLIGKIVTVSLETVKIVREM
jgi:predicted helicase